MREYLRRTTSAIQNCMGPSSKMACTWMYLAPASILSVSRFILSSILSVAQGKSMVPTVNFGAGLMTSPLNILPSRVRAVMLAMASTLLVWVAVYHVADALQALCAFLLRCYQIAVAPLILYGVLLWGLGLYGGYRLAYVGVFGYAATQTASSFWLASTVAIGLVALCLLGLLLYAVRLNQPRPPAYCKTS